MSLQRFPVLAKQPDPELGATRMTAIAAMSRNQLHE
jgi:hypothetical protein